MNSTRRRTTTCKLLFRIVIAIFLSAPALAQPAPLAISTATLPKLSAGIDLHVVLHATGGLPPYSWSVASGQLPDGIALAPDGLFAGVPSKAGPFTVTVKVEDSANPAHSATKEFHATVNASLSFEWLQPPRVTDNRIDGSVQVSNGTEDTFDLTVVIVAIATDSHRETAIGYQHFPLNPGDTNIPINFGNTMPPGTYIVHADAIAEIDARNIILRRRLQTPQPLQIVAGP